MISFARARIVAGLRMPGLIEVGQTASSALVLDDLCLIIECCSPQEREGRWGFVPLR